MGFRMLTLCLVSALATGAFSRSIGLGLDFFNRALGPNTRDTCVFSPISFEVDCVLFAEAADTITRAGIAESIGVLTEFDVFYNPVRDRYLSAVTNGFDWLSARALAVPDVRVTSPQYRARIWSLYGASVARKFPSAGIEAWLRAKTDGRFEDFSMARDFIASERYGLFDLVSLRVVPSVPFPVESVSKRDFTGVDGVKTEVDMMGVVCDFSVFRSRVYTLVRLPLRDGAFLYAAMPADGSKLDGLRLKFTGERLGEILTEPDMLGLPGTARSRALLTMPVLELKSELDLALPLAGSKVPVQPFACLGKSNVLRDSRQLVRFTLAPGGEPEPVEKPDADEGGVALPTVVSSEPLTLDRPFLFFIYHPSTKTLPVAGLYAGPSAK